MYALKLVLDKRLSILNRLMVIIKKYGFLGFPISFVLKALHNSTRATTTTTTKHVKVPNSSKISNNKTVPK